MLDSLGLRARLVLLVPAALSPVCLLGMLAAHQQREKAMEFGRSSLLATARLAVTRQEQLLVKTQNLLQVIARYQAIVADPGADWVPRVVVFAGKAASAYRAAKGVIALITPSSGSRCV